MQCYLSIYRNDQGHRQRTNKKLLQFDIRDTINVTESVTFSGKLAIYPAVVIFVLYLRTFIILFALLVI